MSIWIKVGFASKGSSHVCSRIARDNAPIWNVYPRVINLHSLGTKKVTVLA